MTLLTREDLASQFSGITAELGVASGKYSRVILDLGSPTVHYAIDKWDDHHDLKEYLTALDRLKSIRCRVIRARLEEAVSLFPDSHFDAVYIDTYAHTGQDGGKTLRDWWPKLKVGGIFSGHDYHGKWPKNVREVDRFAKEVGVVIETTASDEYPSWFFKKP